MAVRFSEKEYRELFGGDNSPANKYHNRKTLYDGLSFDSGHERDRYAELRLLEKAGDIHDLRLQPVFELLPAIKENGHVVQRAITYRADFSYYRGGQLVVEDAKGVKTDAYKLKKKMMRSIHGICVQEV